MFKSWTTSADDAESLARNVEAHLNEHAEEVVSVSYAVTDKHRALLVYRPVEPTLGEQVVAVTVAEHILEQNQG